MNTNFLKATFNYGLMMGLGFCLYTTLMWLTGLDSTHLNIGQYLDMLIVFWPVTVIFWAIRQEQHKQPLAILQRIGLALWIGLVSYLIYEPYLYIYHHYINPDWFSFVLDLKETELKVAKVSAEKIAETLQQMAQTNASQNGIFKLSTFVPSVLVLPTLIALLSLIFIRKKAK